jgi:hypothetical protein
MVSILKSAISRSQISLLMAILAFLGSTLSAQEPTAADNPGEARAYAVLRRSPDRVTALPADVYVRALAEMAPLTTYSTGAGQMLPASTATFETVANEAQTWNSLGPDNVGGRTRAFLLSSGFGLNAGPWTMYAAGVDGGVFQGSISRSVDGFGNGVWSSAWSPLQGAPNQPIGNMAVSTLSSWSGGSILAGTGEGVFSGDAIQGNGIYQWDGTAWNTLGPQHRTQDNPNFVFVNRLVSNQAANRLYAGTRAGVEVSNDGGDNWALTLPRPANSQGGVMDLVVIPSGQLTNVSGDVVFVTMGTEGHPNTNPPTQASIWRSTDNGQTWGTSVKSEPTGKMGRTSLAVVPSTLGGLLDNVWIYAVSSWSEPFFDGRLYKIFRSTSGGSSSSWQDMYAGTGNNSSTVNTPYMFSALCSTQSNNNGWYDQAISVDPANANKLLLGGVSIFRVDLSGSAMGSLNTQGNNSTIDSITVSSVPAITPAPYWVGSTIYIDTVPYTVITYLSATSLQIRPQYAGPTGVHGFSIVPVSAQQISTWHGAANPRPVYVHADQHSIQPFAGSKLLVGNDGGLFVAENATASGATTCSLADPQTAVRWSSLSSTYQTAQFYHGLPYSGDTRWIGGMQDNGVRTTSAGSSSWPAFSDENLTNTDAGYVGITPDGTSGPFYVSVGYPQGIIYSLASGGTTATQYDPSPPGSPTNPLYVTPFVVDQTSHAVGSSYWLWVGGQTDTAGHSIVKRRRADLLDQYDLSGVCTGNSAMAPLHRVSSMALSADSNRLVLGREDGCIVYSANAAVLPPGSPIWAAIEPPSGQGGFVTSVAFDPFDPNTIYYTVGNAGYWHLVKVKGVFSGTRAVTNLSGLTPDVSLPDAPANVVVPDSLNPGRLWVGTDVGVLTSLNGGDSWAKEVTGFGYADVEWLAQNQRNGNSAYLYAFTHGRGAYQVLSKAYPRGDADLSGVVDVNDVFFLINYLFAGGPAPGWLDKADADCDHSRGVLDVFFLINYLFAGGPTPLVVCPAVVGGQGFGPASAGASDTMAIGATSVPVASATVRVPVYVNDLPGSSLGTDQPSGYDITEVAFEVMHGASCVTDTTFDRTGGVLQGLAVLQENASFEPGGFRYAIDVTGPVPFTHGAAPGDKIGDLVLTLSGCPASVLPLTLTTTGEWAAALGCFQCNGPGWIERPGETGLNGLQVTNGSVTLLGAIPSISSVSPVIGPTAGGTAVTVYGTNFLNGATVSFGGVAGLVTSVQAGQIAVTTPAHAYGQVSVVVTNPDNQTATLTNGFVFDNPPTAALSASPSSGVAAVIAMLDASSSSDPDAAAGDSIVSYRFDFGDGSAPVTQSSSTKSHVYAIPGTYTASVIAADTRGAASNQATRTATVSSGTDGATFTTDSGVPSTMVRSTAYHVWLSIKNTGTTTWTPEGSYQVQSQNPLDNTTFGVARILMGANTSIPPGVTGIFWTWVTAPANRGTYSFQFKMLHGTTNFGDYLVNKTITVTNH